MGRLEVSCRRFAILSGVEQDPGDYAVCVHPGAPGLQRKGTLALITEPAGSYPSVATEACRLTQSVVIESYFADSALSLTSSLLNALDHANTALLQYNYAAPDLAAGESGSGGEGVAVQTGGVKPRRAKVGVTALLIRPDGAGIYLSQMAPTQAYVLHNGILSAIPEPKSWRQAPQHSLAVLSGAQGMGGTGIEDEELLHEQPETTLPAPSLGSGPGIEADLVYRRVEAGDMVVLVSTSLARHLDRERAEQTFFQADADEVINSLYNLATDNGLAEAHACVLELGVAESSGVDDEYNVRAKGRAGREVAENEGAGATPQSQQRAGMPTLKEVLRGPRDWLQRRKLEPEQVVESPSEAADAEAYEPHASSEGDSEQGQWSEPQHPTLLFPQRPIDLPPYQAAQQPDPASEAAPDAWEDWKSHVEELQFDGWEDAPPALDDPRYDASHKVLFKPKSYDDEEEEPVILGEESQPSGPSRAANSNPPRSYQQPAPFTSSFDHAQPVSGSAARTLRPSPSKLDIREMAGAASSWVLTTTRSLLPDQISTGILRPRGAGGAGAKSLPLRFVIAGALVVAGILLILSVLSMAGNSQKAATRNLLQEAQQLETLANQPGLLAADRLQKLQVALGKAQDAATANPDSAEAKLLVTKLDNEIDQVRGITRFGSVKPLFDLDAMDKTAANGSAPAGAAAQSSVSSTLASPLPLNDIIVQSNDAFILDRSADRIYRCQIAAGTCAVLVSAGDTAGGRQVGTIVAVAMRVGALVVVDDKMVSYVLSPDTGAWQAETLGDADALQTPKDVATYDGNLYLLESRPGQISKYLSGQYGQSPTDWIKDEATIEAMKGPVAMAIDGEIYVALADGKILTMQAGKLDKTLTPKGVTGQSAPTRLFTNPDVHDLYLLRSQEGTVTRISKEGVTIATLKAPGLDTLSGVTVDEAKGKFYLIQGRKVFEATLAASTTSPNPGNGNVSVPTQPAAAPPVRPTVAP